MSTFTEENMAELMELMPREPHAEEIDSEAAHRHAISKEQAERNFMITVAKKQASRAKYQRPTLKTCAHMTEATRKYLLARAKSYNS